MNGKKSTRQTFQVRRNTIFYTSEQILQISFPGKGMNGIHFPNMRKHQTKKPSDGHKNVLLLSQNNKVKTHMNLDLLCLTF